MSITVSVLYIVGAVCLLAGSITGGALCLLAGSTVSLVLKLKEKIA